jgi:hypothetical protein
VTYFKVLLLGTPGECDGHCKHFLTYTIWVQGYAIWDKIFIQVKKWNNILQSAPKFSLGKWERNESKWRKNTTGREHRLQGGHIAADYVTVFCILHLTYTPLYLPTYLTICTYNQFRVVRKSKWPSGTRCVRHQLFNKPTAYTRMCSACSSHNGRYFHAFRHIYCVFIRNHWVLDIFNVWFTPFRQNKTTWRDTRRTF